MKLKKGGGKKVASELPQETIEEFMANDDSKKHGLNISEETQDKAVIQREKKEKITRIKIVKPAKNGHGALVEYIHIHDLN